MNKIIFSIATSADVILKANHLCHDTYMRMGYIDRAMPGRVLPGNEGVATYIVAMDKFRTVVGTVRLSHQVSPDIFKVWKGQLFGSCCSLISDALSQPSFCIGSLAVAKDYASLKVSLGLYRMAYEWALGHNMAYGLITMDHRAFRALKMAGWHAVQVGEPVVYLGSPTVPAVIPIRQQTRNAAGTLSPQFNYHTT